MKILQGRGRKSPAEGKEVDGPFRLASRSSSTVLSCARARSATGLRSAQRAFYREFCVCLPFRASPSPLSSRRLSLRRMGSKQRGTVISSDAKMLFLEIRCGPFDPVSKGETRGKVWAAWDNHSGSIVLVAGVILSIPVIRIYGRRDRGWSNLGYRVRGELCPSHTSEVPWVPHSVPHSDSVESSDTGCTRSKVSLWRCSSFEGRWIPCELREPNNTDTPILFKATALARGSD